MISGIKWLARKYAHYLREIPDLILTRMLRLTAGAKNFQGFRIMATEREDVELFGAKIKTALQFIEKNGAGDFRRISIHVPYIIERPVFSGCDYSWPSRLLSIDGPPELAEDSFDEEVNGIIFYLIVAGTRGHLFDKGFFFSPYEQERLERLCCLRAHLFCHKVGLSDFLPPNGDNEVQFFSKMEIKKGVQSDIRRLWK